MSKEFSDFESLVQALQIFLYAWKLNGNRYFAIVKTNLLTLRGQRKDWKTDWNY